MGNRKRQDLAALAVATLVLAGGGIARVATHGGDTTVSTRVLGQTFARPAPATTAPPTTSVPTTAPEPAKPPAPAPQATTTTTAAPPPVTTTTTAAAAPTTTTTAKPDCGTGETRAKAQASVVALSGSGYVVSGSVDIINNLTKPIVVDTLVVRIIYGDQTTDVISVPSAVGTEVAAGETRTIPFDDRPTTKVPTSASIDALDYRVAGVPGCDAHHLKTT
ncbi:MAG: hypothetical protein JWP02_3342 [Acidimicrobiales bacterium]|nr:hypothetical protein [Acidimicrobiales bacterium]